MCVDRGVKCKCGIAIPCWEAQKNETNDPGRRFYGCSRYKDPALRCNFFQWADPKYTERGREVVEELRSKVSIKADELLSLNDDFNLVEKKVFILKEKLLVAEMKNRETMELLMKKDRDLAKFRKLLIFLALVYCVFLVKFGFN